MPPSWRAGTWLLYFLVQVNYLIAFAFNLALGNPAARDDDSIRITCLSGEMLFRRTEQDSYTLTLSLVGGQYTYYLTVVLRTTPLATQERPTSQEVSIPQVESFASSIPPLPVHTPDDTRIVPPGVPYRVPCPQCQYPLERGEYCTSHRTQGLTVLRQGPEATLEEHHRVPFLFLHLDRNLDSTRATRATSPASSTSPVEALIPTTQHARYKPPRSCLPPHVPARQLRRLKC